MKLDNVDLKQLRVENLPKFDKCPCELCDDGCFDRARLKHHPECRRQQDVKRTQLPRSVRCPLTHYQSTFLAAVGPSGRPEDHRRSLCLPPPDNEIPISFKNVPMVGQSSQREHYKPLVIPKTQKSNKPSIQKNDNLIVNRAVPMETKSQYQLEYVEKPVAPITMELLKHPTKESTINITDPSGTIASQTTARSHFKPWISSPAHPYTEIPPVAGHVIFPNQQRNFSTSTGTTFIPFSNPSRAKPVVRVENSGNVPIAGSMDLRTNYQQDYIPHEQKSSRSAPSNLKSKSNEEHVYTRRLMNEISQTTHDYRAYPKHRPPAAFEMELFSSQIQIGTSNNAPTTKSQYRMDFEGIDTNLHPRQPMAAPKDHQRPYIAPIQKMETMTVTKRDFQPLDVSSLPRVRMVPMPANLSTRDENGPMESISMSRHHFQPYESVKVKRYGDPIPSIYVPSVDKFDGRTTNSETYQGRPGPRARPHVADVKIVPIVGKHDHFTNYQLDYHPHGLSICAARAYAIAQQKNEATVPVSAH